MRMLALQRLNPECRSLHWWCHMIFTAKWMSCRNPLPCVQKGSMQSFLLVTNLRRQAQV